MKEIRINGELIFIGSEHDCNLIAAEYDENHIEYDYK